MAAYKHLLIIALGLSCAAAESSVYAESSSSSSTTTAPKPATTAALAPDGTPVVHKSLHKKKKAVAATNPATTNAPTANATPPPSDTATGTKPAPVVITAPVKNSLYPMATSPIIVTKTPVMSAAPAPGTPPVKPPPTIISASPSILKPAPPTTFSTPTVSVGPSVETGLPVAAHTPAVTVGGGPIPTSTILSPSPYGTAPATSSGPSYRSSISESLPPLAPDAASVVPTPHAPAQVAFNPHFNFIDIDKKTHIYPWKASIITTMFYIGEGDTPISSTTNESSAWDEDWRRNNGGADRPDDRSGYASGGHASTINTFYVALPFNDLAFPDKARRWMPSWWYRPPVNGKQVSACQHRWVEIKNARGKVCYAQWEDVGPLTYDHAEYVFGPERPTTYSRAGLDVSPAVWQYLDLDGGKGTAVTSWRFVDAEDVPPGFWLKLDEQALLYRAIKEAKNTLPIQRASTPIDDPSNTNSNKKKVDAAKG